MNRSWVFSNTKVLLQRRGVYLETTRRVLWTAARAVFASGRKQPFLQFGPFLSVKLDFSVQNRLKIFSVA